MTTPANISIGFYFLLQRYSLIHVHCHPIYNVGEMERADVCQWMNGWWNVRCWETLLIKVEVYHVQIAPWARYKIEDSLSSQGFLFSTLSEEPQHPHSTWGMSCNSWQNYRFNFQANVVPSDFLTSAKETALRRTPTYFLKFNSGSPQLKCMHTICFIEWHLRELLYWTSSKRVVILKHWRAVTLRSS